MEVGFSINGVQRERGRALRWQKTPDRWAPDGGETKKGEAVGWLAGLALRAEMGCAAQEGEKECGRGS